MDAGWGQQERKLGSPGLGSDVEGSRPEMYFEE